MNLRCVDIEELARLIEVLPLTIDEKPRPSLFRHLAGNELLEEFVRETHRLSGKAMFGILPL